MKPQFDVYLLDSLQEHKILLNASIAALEMAVPVITAARKIKSETAEGRYALIEKTKLDALDATIAAFDEYLAKRSIR